jgi:hypothetical protein
MLRSLPAALCAVVCGLFVATLIFIVTFVVVSLLWGYDASGAYVSVPTIVAFGLTSVFAWIRLRAT